MCESGLARERGLARSICLIRELCSLLQKPGHTSIAPGDLNFGRHTPRIRQLRCHDTARTMPIYEYQCGACGNRHEFIQKFSDAPKRKCPDCGASRLKRLVSAAAFHLKGSGWYVTDFRDKKKKKADGKDNTSTTASSSSKESDKSATGKSAETSSKSSDSSDKASDKKSAD